MRNGLEMRNGLGGEDDVRYGYPWLPEAGCSKILCPVESHRGYVLPHNLRSQMESRRAQRTRSARSEIDLMAS
jgi:hypothetical protein